MGGAEAAATLRTRLEEIRKSEIQCSFDIPRPNNDVVDKDKTNVVYVPGAGDPKWLYRTKDGTFDTCGSSSQSWYFDNANNPTKIELCPATCTALQTDPKGALQVVYGCTPIVHIN
jgi:hypothetical protein